MILFHHGTEPQAQYTPIPETLAKSWQFVPNRVPSDLEDTNIVCDSRLVRKQFGEVWWFEAVLEIGTSSVGDDVVVPIFLGHPREDMMGFWASNKRRWMCYQKAKNVVEDIERDFHWFVHKRSSGKLRRTTGSCRNITVIITWYSTTRHKKPSTLLKSAFANAISCTSGRLKHYLLSAPAKSNTWCFWIVIGLCSSESQLYFCSSGLLGCIFFHLLRYDDGIILRLKFQLYCNSTHWKRSHAALAEPPLVNVKAVWRKDEIPSTTSTAVFLIGNLVHKWVGYVFVGFATKNLRQNSATTTSAGPVATTTMMWWMAVVHQDIFGIFLTL